MLHLLADTLATTLCRNLGIDSSSKREIYVYGFMLLISTMFSAISILVIAAVLDQFVFACIFLVIYILLRMVSGGYHAMTYSRCYWSSLFTYLCVMNIALLPHKKWSVLLLVVFYSLIICLWAPITTPKHPLSDKKILRNRKLARLFVLIADSWAIYRIDTNNVSDIVCVIVTSIAAVAVMMIIAKIQERRKRYECMGSNR